MYVFFGILVGFASYSFFMIIESIFKTSEILTALISISIILGAITTRLEELLIKISEKE